MCAIEVLSRPNAGINLRLIRPEHALSSRISIPTLTADGTPLNALLAKALTSGPMFFETGTTSLPPRYCGGPKVAARGTVCRCASTATTAGVRRSCRPSPVYFCSPSKPGRTDSPRGGKNSWPEKRRARISRLRGKKDSIFFPC